ncbi:c-type cytochrome [Flavobacterium sp.]|uniref:c-type cytochrome n=1 Tax=Flavobacterium sp. TaxID=239 RepID=UPI0025E17E54|nr:c-type cytochrome [Flavobacterium sp.]
MKKIVSIIMFFIFLSCKNENQKQPEKPTFTEKISGKELFENKGNCIACHQAKQKTIGPSLAKIAKIYKAKNQSIVLFLKEESEPIVDPSQYEIMKANFAITKSMSDEELNALENYIYSFSK